MSCYLHCTDHCKVVPHSILVPFLFICGFLFAFNKKKLYNTYMHDNNIKRDTTKHAIGHRAVIE